MSNRITKFRYVCKDDNGVIFIIYKELSDFLNVPMNVHGRIREIISIDQFSGFCDAAGVEIYDNDIVQFIDAKSTSSESGMSWEDEVCNGIVWFDTEAGRWECTNRLSIEIDQFIEETIHASAVIGNIHQHKHLIK